MVVKVQKDISILPENVKYNNERGHLNLLTEMASKIYRGYPNYLRLSVIEYE